MENDELKSLLKRLGNYQSQIDALEMLANALKEVKCGISRLIVDAYSLIPMYKNDTSIDIKPDNCIVIKDEYAVNKLLATIYEIEDSIYGEIIKELNDAKEKAQENKTAGTE